MLHGLVCDTSHMVWHLQLALGVLADLMHPLVQDCPAECYPMVLRMAFHYPTPPSMPERRVAPEGSISKGFVNIGNNHTTVVYIVQGMAEHTHTCQVTSSGHDR